MRNYMIPSSGKREKKKTNNGELFCTKNLTFN